MKFCIVGNFIMDWVHKISNSPIRLMHADFLGKKKKFKVRQKFEKAHAWKEQYR